jgi:hypothetical protein
MLSGYVATDRSTMCRITGVRRSERDHEDLSCDLGDHQSVRRQLRRIEERIGLPHLEDVVDSERGVLEQVRGLGVDLEWIVVINKVELEPVTYSG